MRNSKYIAITGVSPMFSSGEFKNQDRVRWYEPDQIACDCDGVSSSPYSGDAAEIVTIAMPSVFTGDTIKRLEMLADILMKRRLELCAETPVIADGKYSPNMQKMLVDIIRQKNTSSFQTTVIAARFGSSKNSVTADIIKCGDSAFFAFSKDGSLLSSSLQFNNQPSVPASNQKQIIFGPGDEILVRVEGRLSEYKELAQQSGIKPEYAKNWLVCTPVDSCKEKCCPEKNLLEIKALCLTEDDKLVVPEYLYGRMLASKGKHYRVLGFSSTIKALSPRMAEISKAGFNGKSSATNVLPDHFYSGNFDLFKDSFPIGSNFILCSDGFYSAFDDFSDLYEWLKENEHGLGNPSDREKIMSELHLRLSKKSGDDDISFIWAMPNKGEENEND
jgi:hypothetical protein